MKRLLLATDKLRVSAGPRLLIDGLSMELRAGQRLAVLGQNGSGKTTLLHTLMGLRSPESGNVTLNQRPLSVWPRRELARQVGLLFQHVSDDMPSTVYDTAMLGRLPHAHHWRWENDHDVLAVEQALAVMQLQEMSGRDVSALSGGERQRLSIATLWAQDPQIYLMDEPTNNLDISFQIKVLKIFSERVVEDSKGMVVATHDINLAARFCDQVLLLLGDGQFCLGPAREVLTEEILSNAYECRIRRAEVDGEQIFFADTTDVQVPC